MPISDEIIELAPVKKTKTLMIVLFVVMGVLLAAAVAFFVLYLTAEPPVKNTVSVNSVSISESTTLFSTTDDKGAPVTTASVGGEYTVKATVYFNGAVDLSKQTNLSTGVTWKVVCDGKVLNETDAFKKHEQGMVDQAPPLGEDGKPQSTSVRSVTYYYTFSPKASYVGRNITISAVSQQKTSKSDDISFTIVDQPTEHVFFTNYSIAGGRAEEIKGDSLSLPCYANSSNNQEYRVTFDQKGASGVNSGEYAEISKYDMGATLHSDDVKITIEPANSPVIDFDGGYNYANSRFAFKIKSAGEVDIIVTANVNREGAKEVRGVLHIEAKSTTELKLIDGIYFTDVPVDENFYKANWTNAQNNRALQSTNNVKLTNTLSLPYSEIGSYSNILKHVVLVPFSLQCEKDGDKYTLIDGWQSKINVASSNSSICDVSKTWSAELQAYTYGLGCRKLAAGTQCSITISDSTSGSVAKPCDVKLNIVAPCNDIKLGFKFGDKTYTDKELEASLDENKPANAIAISQSEEAELIVTYRFKAPAGTDVTTMVDNGYISGGFSFAFDDPDFMTVKLGDTAIEAGKPFRYGGKNFTIKLEDKQTQWYIGTATFSLKVGDNSKIQNDFYKLTYNKTGLALMKDDPDVSRSIRFNVTEVATRAEFDEDAAAGVVTANGTRAGKFEIKRDHADGTHECDIYIQNQSKGARFTDIIDINELIRVDQGNFRLSGGISYNNNTSDVFSGSVGLSYDMLTFKGVDAPGSGSPVRQASLTITATAEGTSGKGIGTFVINIFVVNAIESIGCKVADPSLPYNYTGDNFGRNLAWAIDTITATHISPETKADLSYEQTTFKLQYYFNGWTDFEPADIKGEPNNKMFGVTYGGEFYDVFKFNYNDKRIFAVADPFLVAYKCGITIDELRIEYSTVASAYYDQLTKTCFRNYKILREADEIRLYSDKYYTVEVDKESDGYSFALNQNDSGTLYASAVIFDESNEPIIVGKRTGLSKCETVYMLVPANIGLSSLSGKPYEEIQNAYTYISFIAPPVANSADASQVYNGIRLCRVYDTSGMPVTITVNNAARPIEEFGLYSDAKCSTKLEKLEFGKFTDGGDMPYTKTFYVRIEYSVAKPGTYVYFEKANLVLPSYLRLKISDSASDGGYLDYADKYEIGAQARPYTGEDGSAKNTIDDPDIVLVQPCTVTLDVDSAKYSDGTAENDVIELSCASKTQKSTARATVGTGISHVTYTLGENTYNSADNNDLPINIVLGSATDVKTVKIPFSIVTFADGTDYAFDAQANRGIQYNIANVEITGSDVVGLEFNPSKAAGDMYLSITVDKGNIRNIDRQPFAVTFKDSASGTAREIRLNFTVTVESDIYAIAPSVDAFTTKGAGNAVQKSVTVEYNGGETLLQPSAARINAVTAKVYTKNGDRYDDTTADISVSGSNGNFTVRVGSGVLTSVADGKQLYYIGLTYGEKTYYAPIIITTESEEIALEVRGNISVAGEVVNGRAGTARVEVKSPSDSFDLAAYVFNRGNLDRSDSAVTYKLYASAADRAADTNELSGETAVAVIDAHGTFKFVKPRKTSDTVYYRASFTDGGRNELRYIDVDIEYDVSVSDVALEGVNGVLDGDTLTLYYIGDGLYTRLDLTDFVKARTAFDGVDVLTETSISVQSGDESKLAVNGYTVYPTGATENKVRFVITANDGMSEIHAEYYALIKTPTSPVLTGNGKIDVIENNMVTFSAQIPEYDGLKYEYFVEGYNADMFDVQKQGTVGSESITVSVKRATYNFDGTEYAAGKTYPLTVRVKYSADGMSGEVVGGENFSVRQYAYVSLKWERYVPMFIVYGEKDGVRTPLGRSDDDNPINVAYDYRTAYTIELDDSKVIGATWYDADDWTYIATDGNDIVTVGAFVNRVAPVTFGNAFGTVSFKVTASAYGNTIAVSKDITFNYGDKTTASISVSEDDGATYTPITLVDNAAEVEIDFGTAASGMIAARKFRYEIDATGVGIPVDASDVKIIYGGDVTVEKAGGNIVRSDEANKFYVIFTANDVTRFTVGSTIAVGGRTYHKDTFTLDLTAESPSITAKAECDEIAAESILPDKTAVFGVTVADNGFIGNYTVEYRIVDGSDVADIAQDGTLTPKKNNTADRRVAVGITVTVTDGCFAGNVYNVEKSIVITGVALPELVLAQSPKLTWTGDKTTVNSTGVAVDFGGEFTLSDVVAGDKTYVFASNATFAYSFTAPSGYTASEYAAAQSRLTVRRTDKTRAGGRFELTVTATLGSGINGGKQIERTFYIDVVPFAVAGNGVSISARKGSYDVKSAVALKTGDESVGQISADDEYAVSYVLANGDTNVVVGGANRKLSELVTVTGSIITLKESVPADVTVVLTPTVTMKSGAYAGMSFGGADTSVKLNGFNVAAQNIAWDSSENVNAYPEFNVADNIPQAVKNIGTPIIEVRVLTYASYVLVSHDGTSSPTLAIDKNINVLATSGAAKTVELEYIVSFAGSEIEYYGKGSIAVASISPDVTVTLTPAPRTEDGEKYVDLTSGESLGVSLGESHGLDISNVATGDLGNYLTSVSSGGSIVITAGDVATSQMQSVSISYSVNGIDGSYSVIVSVLPRGDSSLFTVTNENVTVMPDNKWVSYNSGSTSGFVSDWIATDTNQYAIPYYVQVRSNRGYVSSVISCLKLQAYDKAGNAVGNEVQLASQGYYLNSNISSISNTAVYRVRMTFGMNANFADGAQFTVTYQSKSASGATTSTTKTYTCLRNNTIPITLNANASGTNWNTQTVYLSKDQTYSGITDKPVRDGYTTNSWYFDKDCTQQASGAILGYSHTLYAKWDKAKYNVEFDFNGGKIGGSTSVTCEQTYGDKYALPATDPSRSGYKFDGWYTTNASTGGSRVTSDTVVPIDPATLYARWTPYDYTVTFSNAELDAFSSTKTVTYASQYGALPIPTKLGYTFGGWYKEAGFVNKITDTTEVNTASNHYLYAKWTPDPYSVTLNAVGGSLVNTVVDVKFDAKYPDMDVPSKTGYTFDGWYTAPDGAGEKITDGTGANAGDKTVTIAADHTLYANWIAQTIEVTFSDATVTPEKISATFGETFSALSGVTVAERVGYEFVEWRDGDNKVVTADTAVKSTNNVVLKAVWKADECMVTFANTESAISPIKITFGQKYGALPVPVKTGYEFVEWRDAGGNAVTADKIVDAEGDVVLTAVWSAKTYNVVLVMVAGDVTTQNLSVTYLDGKTFGTLPEIDKSGYAFKGWFASAAFDSQITATSVAFGDDGELLHTVLFAKYVPTYTVSFENTVSAIAPITVTFGEKYGELSEPQKTGYTFGGWYLDGEIITKDSVVSATQDHSLTAAWNAKTYGVTLDADGGSFADGNTKSLSFSYDDETYPALDAPTTVKENCTFGGWYTERDGGGRQVTAIEFAENSDELGYSVLYAKWNAVEETPAPGGEQEPAAEQVGE